jgi:hypothetical protein
MQCPLCEAEMHRPRVALSRVDNKTEICPACGLMEGLQSFADRIERGAEL